MKRAIVHLDADAFFASVEQAADPRLRGKPIAVGGEKRGIIASASYEARRYGITTPMPTVHARRLCPHLILLPGDFEKYERFSRWMFSYAYDFTPDVEISSIDEGYFDLTGSRRPSREVAETVRRAIRDALKISVSEGLASNKLISQIACKLRKPAAMVQVPPGREKAFLDPLPNRWLPGIGPHTAARLNAAGLTRIGQIAATPVDCLALLVGASAPTLREFANGIDDRPLVREVAPAKSYSRQQTFEKDTIDEAFVEATLRHMADDLMRAVREDGKTVRTLTVKVRYNDMDEHQCSESLVEPTDLETDVYGRIRPLLRQAWRRRVSLRMVSLKCSNLYDGLGQIALPLDGTSRTHDARRRLAETVCELRHTYGHTGIMRGHDMRLAERVSSFEFRVSSCTASGTESHAAPNPKPGTTAGGHIHSPGDEPTGHCPIALIEGRGGQTSPFADRTPMRRENEAANEDVRPPRDADLGTSGGRRDNVAAFPAGGGITRKLSPPISLHIHSYYSFLDSTLSPRDIVDLAAKYEVPAVALTDTGNLHGAVPFFQAATAAGIRPILGAEIRVDGNPLLLYVENRTGYGNLCRILTRGDRFGSDAFEVETAGLIAVGADPALAHCFPGAFYLGVGSRVASCGFRVSSRETASKSKSKSKSKKGTDLATRIPHPASRISYPVVAVPATHYAAPEDRRRYDIVQSIRTLTLLDQPHPEKRRRPRPFRTPEWMRNAFAADPRLLDHTREIAERCDFAFDFGVLQFPAFRPPGGLTPQAFLRALVLRGVTWRYGARSATVHPQIEEELAIIHEVGYEEYFLVVWDLLQTCRQRGIEWITRGSAADSLVCYCLGISDVCPIRFDLYFRRFLNRERMQMNKLPDIDIDFAHDRKDDVVDLMFEIYGTEHTAVVGGFSTFQSRSALADVAKVLGVSDHQIRQWTKRVPYHSRAGDLGETLRRSVECRDLPVDEEPYATALDMAAFLDGFPRNPKMHPCGVVLSRRPMAEMTPCFISNKGYPTTHFDMDAIEDIGLVKIDILAQGGLAAIRDVRAMLAARGIEVDLERMGVRDAGCGMRDTGYEMCLSSRRVSGRDTSRETETASTIKSKSKSKIKKVSLPHPASDPWTDPAVWDMIARGDARAVHHIESPAMISLCRMCNVRDIDTLIAVVSVIRPGAANQKKKKHFTLRYQGLEPVTYPHPSLEPCLKSTFGMLVYEEQVLQICDAFTSMPPGEADRLRRALNKRDWERVKELGKRFTACARERGRAPDEVRAVWKLLCGFNGYSFCKAHSTAYGVEAYQAAWLKCYYPAEFMAAVLTNGKGFYPTIVYILECHRLGIRLLPPRITDPGPGYQVRDGNAIRVPIAAVKGLTAETEQRILNEYGRTPFTSLRDFSRRAVPARDEIETLLRVGAFDDLGRFRTDLFWEIQWLTRAFGRRDQGSLFTQQPDHPAPPIALTQPTCQQRLDAEHDLLGFTVSGHPLERYPDIAWDTYCPVADIAAHAGRQVTCCGLIVIDRVVVHDNGESMKFMTIADRTGMIETEMFANTYKHFGLATVRYPVLEVTATVEAFDNDKGYTLNIHRAGKPRTTDQRQRANSAPQASRIASSDSV